MNRKIFLEACVGSVDCGQMVSALGVDRLEFCANLEIGGTTPSLASIPLLKECCDCKIHVLIRPRAGDFLYSALEFRSMLAEIAQCRALGVDGVVFGMLNADGTLDVPRMAEAIAVAGDLSVTLHRAFDMCKDPFATLDLAAQMGVDTILTSGQAKDALQGLPLLRQLQDYAKGRATVMACGGIGAEKLRDVHQQTGITTFHMAGLQLSQSEMLYRNKALSMGSDAFDEFTLRSASPKLFAAAIAQRDAMNALACGL